MIKIAIIGPESTGKSALSQFLAQEFDCPWVPEFSRAYCEKLDRACDWQDELNIFEGQIAAEESALKALGSKGQLLICDTTILTVKFWCEHVFGKSPQEVEEESLRRNYDLYLLCNTDLPWEDDPLRDFPDLREHFFEVYYKYLQGQNVPFKIISGIGADRFAQAKKMVQVFLTDKG